MKIWIVSSDSFLNDFKKISTSWPESNNIVITPITKFGIGIRSFILFYKEYLKIKPDRILTDVGYLGLYFIIIFNKIFNKNLKTVFYLRGNYWIEEKGRNENI